MTPSQTLSQAIADLNAGRLADAEKKFRAVIAQFPGYPDALHLLGCTLSKAGRREEAIDLIRRAIAIDPKQPVFYANLGHALLAAGKKDQAVAALTRVLDFPAISANSFTQLGNTLTEIGEFELAARAFTRALETQPDQPGLHFNLGNCWLRKATSIRLDVDPAQRAAAMAQRNDLLTKSVAAFEKTLALQPGFVDAYNNLAMAYVAMDKMDQAIATWRRATAMAAHPISYYNLGRAFYEKDLIDDAIDAIQNSIRLNPNQPDSLNNLGNMLRQSGRIEESIAMFDRATALQPTFSLAQSNRLYTLYYHPTLDSQRILSEHKKWNDFVARPLAQPIPPHDNHRSSTRRLRIGYVSPNFWAHCQSLFTLPLFSNHDHANFEIFAYSDVKIPDAVTEKIKNHCDHWQSIMGMNDVNVAEQIRRDKIDILVDLTLHMAENRILLFARKPAPVQITWLGYPGTTGLQTIDYRLTDRYLDPPGERDEDYTEKSWRLPDTFWCFDRDSLEAAEIPSPNPLPALEAGGITFGCFNNFCKINQPLLDLWKRVLDSVPNSRFILRAPFGSPRNWVRQTLGDRVEFLPRADRPGYLKYYHRIDIGLDTLPYNGHTTTLDSLWMGVPVISLIGPTVVGRAGLSQFSNLGLQEFAVATADAFVEKAIALANDVARLTELRATLRDRMRSSPLLDGPKFTRGVETAYRQIWQQYCR